MGKRNIRKDMLSRAHDDQPRSLHNNIKCSSKKTFLKVSKYYRLVSTFVRSCHWALTMINWYITDIRYSAKAQLYLSSQPSVFYHILLNDDVIFFPFNSSIKRLMCAVVVAEYCFLPSNKKEWNTAWRGHDFVDVFIPVLFNALKFSSEITSIDTDLFPL